MHSLKTVLWDLDGTIADTELSGHRIAFNQAFKECFLDWYWDEETYINLLKFPGGKNRLKQYSLSSSHQLSDSKIKEIHNKKQKFYSSILKKGQIKIRPGVHRLTSELKEMGVSQWIVTSSGISSVKSLVDSSFKEYANPFSGLITSEDVINHKPNPECYLLALKKSNSEPQNTIAIEDSIEGFRAAKAAGLNCLVTLSPWINQHSQKFDEAKLVVNHLGDKQNTSKSYAGYLSGDMINYKILNRIINT